MNLVPHLTRYGLPYRTSLMIVITACVLNACGNVPSDRDTPEAKPSGTASPAAEPLASRASTPPQDRVVDAAPAPRDALTALLDSCDAPPGKCGDLVDPVWQKFESETGEVVKLDTASIQPVTTTGTIATIYSYSPGAPFDPTHLRQLMFTCRGQFAEMGGLGDPLIDAPPRSVIGTVAATACRLAEPIRRKLLEKRAQLDEEAHDRAIHPRSEDYCRGFSSESCATIKAGVEDVSKPSFCRPGFALAGSGLTEEELRICYARAPKDDPL